MKEQTEIEELETQKKLFEEMGFMQLTDIEGDIYEIAFNATGNIELPPVREKFLYDVASFYEKILEAEGLLEEAIVLANAPTAFQEE